MDDRTVEQKLAEYEITVNALMEQLGAERRDRLCRDAAVILAGMIVAEREGVYSYEELRGYARREAFLTHEGVDAEVSRREAGE